VHLQGDGESLSWGWLRLRREARLLVLPMLQWMLAHPRLTFSPPLGSPGQLPIPGAKSASQLKEIAGAMGWRLSDGEMAELDKVSTRERA
jgi:aryl-alcohol dehydrogenase-like predicted oxidoreductase